MLRRCRRDIAGRTSAEDMGETEPKTVLGRIAAAGREERKARAMTLQKALRVTMAKVADTLMDLPLAVIGAVVQSVAGDDIEAALDDAALLLLLDGPARCVGAVVFDPVLVGGLIQQQTIGSVQAASGDSRLMTRTDAAICAPLVDMLVARAARIVDDPDDKALLEGFQFGAKAENSRTLAMALDASDYISIKLTLDVARGVRQGEMTLILPTLAARAEAQLDPEDGIDAVVAPKGPDFAKSVMGLNAELEMVLCRLQVPLKTLRSLKVGQTVALRPNAFPNVQITTRTGRVLGRGVVGHVDGVRAVKPLRAPSHASQPLRRDSDTDAVEMPQLEVLSATGRRSTVPREIDVSDDELREAMRATPAGVDAKTAKPSRMAPLPPAGHDDDAAFDIADLPELDDLPDLTDVPDLESASDFGALPDFSDLPDLDDLPDLALQSVG